MSPTWACRPPRPKKATILGGEGDAEARKLVMAADGALDKKLATYQAVMVAFAEALPQVKGRLFRASSWAATVRRRPLVTASRTWSAC